MPFEIGEIDVEGLETDLRRMKKEAEDAEKPRVPMFYLKNGNTTMWVLPPSKNSSSWFYQVKEHSFKLDEKWYYKKCLGDDCPLCTVSAEFYERGGEANVKKAQELRPSTRGYINALICSGSSGVT